MHWICKTSEHPFRKITIYADTFINSWGITNKYLLKNNTGQAIHQGNSSDNLSGLFD